MKRFDNLFLLGLMSMLSPLGALAQVAPADQGTMNHRDSNAVARRETARPVRLTVPPNGQAPITMTTLPDAICSLHPDGDTSHSMKLLADEDGIVRFDAGGAEESNITTRLVLDCAADGVAQTFPLELRSNPVPTADMPAPAQVARKVKPGTVVLPALTEFEAANLSDEELRTRGYPGRPDSGDSRARATWLKAVSQPVTVVRPKLVAIPEITHQSLPRPSAQMLTSNPSVLGLCCAPSPYTDNWSGFQLQGPKNKSFSYAFVTGTWTVPKVTDSTDGKRNALVIWVGLDGWGLSDLVQAGTGYKVDFMSGMKVSSSFAWSEILPLQPFFNQISNLPVEAGDVVTTSVWVGDAQSQSIECTGVLGGFGGLGGSFCLGVPVGLPTVKGPYFWFQITVTGKTNTYTSGPLMFGLQTFSQGIAHEFVPVSVADNPVPGYEAEWIVERPSLVSEVLNDLNPRGLSDLASWGATTPIAIQGAHAQLSNSSTVVLANSSNSLAITMVSGFDANGRPAGNVLSKPAGAKTCPTPTTCKLVADEVLFMWQHPN